MASEIRVNKINSSSGVGTITLSPTGVDISGVTTASTLRATTGIITTLQVGTISGDGSSLTGVASTENIRTNTNAAFLQNVSIVGTSTVTGNIIPSSDSATDIGTNSVRFQNAYVDTYYGSGANLTGISAGLSNIVEDTSPQLGADLDVNTKNIVFANSSSVGNDDTLKFGDSAELVIAFDGSHGRLDYTGSGSLQNKIAANSYFQVVNRDTGDNMIQGQAGGDLELYYNGGKKFETISDGVAITNIIQQTSSTNLFYTASVAGAVRLQFNHTGGGDVTISNPSSGSVTYNTSSDYRLKENEATINNALTTVKALKPYQFTWKHSSQIGQGFFAHEVLETTPNSKVVSGTKDQVATADDVTSGIATAVGDPIYQQVDYSKLVPLLTAALQEAVTKIETLETKVAALEGS